MKIIVFVLLLIACVAPCRADDNQWQQLQEIKRQQEFRKHVQDQATQGQQWLDQQQNNQKADRQRYEERQRQNNQQPEWQRKFSEAVQKSVN